MASQQEKALRVLRVEVSSKLLVAHEKPRQLSLLTVYVLPV
jgi:hypothetical protein